MIYFPPAFDGFRSEWYGKHLAAMEEPSLYESRGDSARGRPIRRTSDRGAFTERRVPDARSLVSHARRFGRRLPERVRNIPRSGGRRTRDRHHLLTARRRLRPVDVHDRRASGLRTEQPRDRIGRDASSFDVPCNAEYLHVVGEDRDERGPRVPHFRSRTASFVANRRGGLLPFATSRARSRRFVTRILRLRFPAPPPRTIQETCRKGPQGRFPRTKRARIRPRTTPRRPTLALDLPQCWSPSPRPSKRLRAVTCGCSRRS
jgi:hypothetical protein